MRQSIIDCFMQSPEMSGYLNEILSEASLVKKLVHDEEIKGFRR